MENNFEIKKTPIETEENLSVDAQGNARTLRAMPDGSVQSLSDQEFAAEKSAIAENNREAMGM